jgi:hypothetical protein
VVFFVSGLWNLDRFVKLVGIDDAGTTLLIDQLRRDEPFPITIAVLDPFKVGDNLFRQFDRRAAASLAARWSSRAPLLEAARCCRRLKTETCGQSPRHGAEPTRAVDRLMYTVQQPQGDTTKRRS